MLVYMYVEWSSSPFLHTHTHTHPFSHTQGYFRRAEAYKSLAQSAFDRGVDSRSRRDLFIHAVKDYSKCYKKMASMKEVGMRVKPFFEAMVIAVEYCKCYTCN